MIVADNYLHQNLRWRQIGGRQANEVLDGVEAHQRELVYTVQ
jgi:hypothetical protein